MSEDTRRISTFGGVALKQLYLDGPTWDGDLATKSGRDELVDKGLAQRVGGFSFLTYDGVKAALTFPWHRMKMR